MGRLEYSGRVTDRAGKSVAGGRVELLHPVTKKVVAAGLTGPNGRWRIRVDKWETPRLFSDLAGMRTRVRVRGKSERSLGAVPVVADVGKTGRAKLALTPGNARRFNPVFPQAARQSGSPLDETGLTFIDQAIRAMVPGEGNQQRRYIKAARCPLPPIANFDGILDDAWGVIDGDPGAERRFRQALVMISERIEAKQPGLIRQAGVFLLSDSGLDEKGFDRILDQPFARRELALSGRAAVEFQELQPLMLEAHQTELPHPNGIPSHPCMFPTERALPLYVAAFQSARDFTDAAGLVGALEHGFCGVGGMNHVFGAALRGLAEGRFEELGGLLGLFAGECGPDDGPVPPWPEPDPRPCPGRPPGGRPTDLCDLERWACTAEIVRNLPRIVTSRRETYRIDLISPNDACSGERVTIRGSNFGDDPGLVCFPRGSWSRARICVPAESWSETEIVAIVPDEAGSGDLSLHIVDDRAEICGRIFEVVRRGTGETAFVGGKPHISMLTVNGRGVDPYAEPGSTATISWNASRGGSGTRVRIRVRDGGRELVDQRDLRDNGTLNFNVPDTTAEKTLTVILTAANPCGTVEERLDLLVTVVPVIGIVDMEVTQAIQRFWRPGVTWNSLPTIAGKDTIVRAYIICDRSGFLDDRARVTGTLRVNGTILTPINGITPTSATGDPFIEARSRAEIDREVTDHTLNFRIPAALCGGTKRLQLTVYTDQRYGRSRPSASLTKSRTWEEEPALRVRFVRIRDNRSGGTGTIPSEAEARFTIERGFDLLPSPAEDIAPARVATWNTTRDFTTNGGLRGLLNDLDDEHNCSAWEWLWGWTGLTDCPDDDEANWVGLTSPFNRGWAERPGNTCISAVYEDADGQNAILRIKTAHELGHNLSFRHVNQTCGAGGSIGGPFYNHPNNGALQDVPFDPYWNQAVSGNVQDFMSYGCARWTSGDSWTRLRGEI